jgi:general secretion pathway protein H
MDKRGEVVRQAISSARRDKNRAADKGFTLLEMVCVIAILAIMAGIAIPALPHATSRARLESYAVATAALLKADRNAALRRQQEIATAIDASARYVRSGSSGRILRVPDDVEFNALLSRSCSRNPVGSGITFFPTGMSCGGVIALTRAAAGYEIRVNWLTGGVEVVPVNRT